MAKTFEVLKPGERAEAKEGAGFEANKDKGTHESFPLKYSHD